MPKGSLVMVTALTSNNREVFVALATTADNKLYLNSPNPKTRLRAAYYPPLFKTHNTAALSADMLLLPVVFVCPLFSCAGKKVDFYDVPYAASVEEMVNMPAPSPLQTVVVNAPDSMLAFDVDCVTKLREVLRALAARMVGAAKTRALTALAVLERRLHAGEDAAGEDALVAALAASVKASDRPRVEQAVGAVRAAEQQMQSDRDGRLAAIRAAAGREPTAAESDQAAQLAMFNCAVPLGSAPLVDVARQVERVRSIMERCNMTLHDQQGRVFDFLTATWLTD
jgi:hypothetical protein